MNSENSWRSREEAARPVIAIDASRNKSGGAVAHIVGILTRCDPRDFGISHVHLWAHRSLRSQIPEYAWLTKHEDSSLDGPISSQLLWQLNKLPLQFERLGCHLLFKSDAGSICRVANSVTLAQDMLAFEPSEMGRYGISRERLRLEVLKRVQARSLSSAVVSIYPTEYARRTITTAIGAHNHSMVIHHGIDEQFWAAGERRKPWPANGPIQCLYVSNTAPYKHQWCVVEAVALARARGLEIELTLVGGGQGPAQRRLEGAIQRFDPDGRFVHQLPFVPHGKIPDHLAAADLFVFASSCESISITLLEAMAAGLPICASDRGPLPEVLADGGVYFDPENPPSIATAIQTLAKDPVLRDIKAARARDRSKAFTWENAAKKTWRVLANAARSIQLHDDALITDDPTT